MLHFLFFTAHRTHNDLIKIYARAAVLTQKNIIFIPKNKIEKITANTRAVEK